MAKLPCENSKENSLGIEGYVQEGALPTISRVIKQKKRGEHKPLTHLQGHLWGEHIPALPETSSSHLKMDGWKMKSPLKMA